MEKLDLIYYYLTTQLMSKSHFANPKNMHEVTFDHTHLKIKDPV